MVSTPERLRGAANHSPMRGSQPSPRVNHHAESPHGRPSVRYHTVEAPPNREPRSIPET
jgi:hypothetical protein